MHGAEDVGKAIVHGGAESAAALRAAAARSLVAQWQQEQKLLGAAQAVGRALEDAGKWAVAYRGTLAALLAIAGCLAPGFDVFCGAYLAGAYVVRAQQRIASYGFRRSLDANAADAVMTGAFAVPMAGAFAEGLTQGGRAVGAGLKLLVNGVATVPDVVQFVGGFLPGHDPVFFNGNTLGP